MSTLLIDSRARTLPLLGRFASEFLKPHMGKCVSIAALMLLAVALQLVVPLVSIYIFDRLIPARRLDLLSIVGWGLLGFILARHLLTYFSDTLTLRVKEQVILEIQVAAVKHLQHLPLGFFSLQQSSYLQSRVMSDSRSIEGALVRTFASLAVDGLTFLFGLGLLLAIRVELGLLLCVLLVPFGYLRFYANERMRVLSQGMQESTARASALIAETFSGIRTVKAYGREEHQQSQIVARLSQLRDVYIRTNWFGVVSTVGASLITSVSAALVLWFGSRAVIRGSLTIGGVVASVAVLALLFNPVNNFVTANLKIQQSAVAIQRIFEFLRYPAEPSTGLPLRTPVEGRIEFEDVHFGYSAGADVLRGVDFRIEPGQTVALVGRSGAGKTTMVNLLLGFYAANAGEVRIDGRRVDELQRRALRAHVGVVDQTAFLFSGTILDNIRFGKLEASEEEAIEASRRAYADEFVRALPQGYETVVGERGVRLSGGQCQRIALARMFLKDPAIVVLDEAVSSVDSASEAMIQDAVRELMAGRTTILIAHRLSSLQLADEVLVLDEGRIVERGTHEELLAADGVYTALFREQFEPGSRDAAWKRRLAIA